MNANVKKQLADADQVRDGDDAVAVRLPSGLGLSPEQVAAFEALGSFEDANDTCKALRPLPPPIIKGLLRKRDFGTLTGPSKSRKTYELMHVATCVAYGVSYYGFPVCKVPVLYLNYELHPGGWDARLSATRSALRIPADADGVLRAWQLRGKTLLYKDLSAAIQYRLWKEKWETPPGLIIIDPAYKTWTGIDEIKSGEMALVYDALGKLVDDLNSAVILCLHATKGKQAGKRSLDMSSGAGVQGRSPDCAIALRIDDKDIDEPAPITWFHATLRHDPSPPKFAIQFDLEKKAMALVLNPPSESPKWKDEDLVLAFSNEDSRMRAKDLVAYYTAHSGKGETSGENTIKRLVMGGSAVLGKVGNSTATRYYLTPRGREVRRAKLGQSGSGTLVADSSPVASSSDDEF